MFVASGSSSLAKEGSWPDRDPCRGERCGPALGRTGSGSGAPGPAGRRTWVVRATDPAGRRRRSCATTCSVRGSRTSSPYSPEATADTAGKTEASGRDHSGRMVARALQRGINPIAASVRPAGMPALDQVSRGASAVLGTLWSGSWLARMGGRHALGRDAGCLLIAGLIWSADAVASVEKEMGPQSFKELSIEAGGGDSSSSSPSRRPRRPPASTSSTTTRRNRPGTCRGEGFGGHITLAMSSSARKNSRAP